MAPSNSLHNPDNVPLYSSRIAKIYLQYLSKHYPDIDIDSILDYAGMEKYAVEDTGHWFTQYQADRFHEILVRKTGNPNIAQEAGRYAASSGGIGPAKQYTLGLMSLSSVYLLMGKIYAIMSRGATVKASKLGPEKVQIISTPRQSVNEKPYQCENRIGTFESLAKLFTDKFATVEHPSCFHKGDDCCRYIVSWEKTPYIIWKRARNYLTLLGLVVCGTLYFFVSHVSLAAIISLFVFVIAGVFLYSEHLEKKELVKNIESQGDAAKGLLDEINIRYNNALLVQEVGQATSTILDIDKLIKAVASVMENRLNFDRGGIWLANRRKTRLVYKTGYGYSPKIEKVLTAADFHLDRSSSKGIVVQAFRKQKPYLVDDISELKKDFSKRSLEFVKKTGAQSFICVPVVYEGEPLGVVLVDNLKSKNPLTQSDMNLLMGIAPQIAVSIHNAMSYKRLQKTKEREKNLRKLFEKYVPAPIIKQYVDSREVDLFRGQEFSITSLFLDIRRFTSSTEAMDARDVVSFLNDYFERCSLVISEEKGHINKYTGDGFLAIFGAPETIENHITQAFNAAYKILQLSNKLTLAGKPMGVGIGLHAGRAILGNIGSNTKIEYTAIGDTVNTAARLQDFTKVFRGYPVIMSRDVWEKLANHPYHNAIRNLGMQEIQGKKEKLEAFGFAPSKDGSLPIAQRDKGPLPLQSIKGV
jgi:class 3 adenylate cyclase